MGAGNLWVPISVRKVELRALLNRAVPVNEFVDVSLPGANGPLADTDRLAHWRRTGGRRSAPKMSGGQ